MTTEKNLHTAEKHGLNFFGGIANFGWCSWCAEPFRIWPNGHKQRPQALLFGREARIEPMTVGCKKWIIYINCRWTKLLMHDNFL